MGNNSFGGCVRVSFPRVIRFAVLTRQLGIWVLNNAYISDG
jgi:hypothetical protein